MLHSSTMAIQFAMAILTTTMKLAMAVPVLLARFVLGLAHQTLSHYFQLFVDEFFLVEVNQRFEKLTTQLELMHAEVRNLQSLIDEQNKKLLDRIESRQHLMMSSSFPGPIGIAFKNDDSLSPGRSSASSDDESISFNFPTPTSSNSPNLTSTPPLPPPPPPNFTFSSSSVRISTSTKKSTENKSTESTKTMAVPTLNEIVSMRSRLKRINS